MRRVSLGTAVSQAAYAVAQRATAELLATGTHTTLDDALDFGTINNAVGAIAVIGGTVRQ
ncbi:MAG TPA: hypothetical protein VHW44_01570 [Pseudonocardiaceae bacterium]|nr:hypothetical protein [Pseudonocardiaceae bacterium]